MESSSTVRPRRARAEFVMRGWKVHCSNWSEGMCASVVLLCCEGGGEGGGGERVRVKARVRVRVSVRERAGVKGEGGGLWVRGEG